MDIEKIILEILNNKLNKKLNEFNGDLDFRDDLGMSSFDFWIFIMEFENITKHEIKNVDNIKTLNDLKSVI